MWKRHSLMGTSKSGYKRYFNCFNFTDYLDLKAYEIAILWNMRHWGGKNQFLPHGKKEEVAQSLNVEKWGWDFSTLSGEATKVEKEFSPWVMNGLAGVVKKNFPISSEAASGEILFLPQLLSHEWRMGKITHPHFSTLRDLHFHIERENFTTKGGKDLFYPRWWHQG